MPTKQVISLIRRKLQPGYAELEKTSSIADAEAAVVISPELVDAISSGECVLCTGFGLAAQAKLPTWPALLNGLLRRAREDRVLDTATANSLASALANGEFEAAADELTHQVSRDLVLSHMRSVTTESEPSEAHAALAEIKFLGALSLSIDELVATVFKRPVLVPSQADKLVTALQARKFFVANLFGTVQQPSSLLFTMKEFRHLLQANSELKQFLGTLFLRYTIVFVGLGMDGLRDFMEALELPQAPERKHYAILPNAAQIDPVKARFFERSYNIRVVDYQPQLNYEGLPVFLKELQQRVKQNLPQSEDTAPSTLRSVTLENIGPFHSLQVEFTPQWNLLLGDNGVGKTVLLKAIAAALCGDKADPVAVAQLLRAGAQKGSITLKDEKREYVVELERKTDGSVRIVSASLSPIIYERWLVLGFPALRSIPMAKANGPEPLRREAPSAEDLLPLLWGELDDRGGDIKQWLVNLDYATKSESEDLRTRGRGLTRDFFKVLQLLTPGLRLDQGPIRGINNRTYEVSVVTDSGTVPLEFISQGTGAVMCWIGTLLERLSETGQSRQESRNSALVLIDELDAHMHPKWQQLFVDAFRQEFKSVQIIATTHSPLLVGSLKPEEIWRIHRVPLRSEIYGRVHLANGTDGRREITVVGLPVEAKDGYVSAPDKRTYSVPAATELAVDDGDVVDEQEPLTKADIRVVAERVTKEHGWRADQILTSPLFELETSRDPETARMLKAYTQLTALSNPSTEQQTKLAELAETLQIRLATPQETEAARAAYNLIDDFAEERLKDLPEDKRRQVLVEVKNQLTESITGSRRRT